MSSPYRTPYRTPPRAQIVVRSQPLTSTVVLAIWLSTMALVITGLLIDHPARLRLVWLAVGFVGAVGFWLVRRFRARVRFDLVLDGTVFRVERITGSVRESMGQLSVGEGADVSVRAMSHDAVLDGFVCVKNQHGEIAFQPGGHAGEIAMEVLGFLQANGIKARDRLPRGPVDMSSMGPMGPTG